MKSRRRASWSTTFGTADSSGEVRDQVPPDAAQGRKHLCMRHFAHLHETHQAVYADIAETFHLLPARSDVADDHRIEFADHLEDLFVRYFFAGEFALQQRHDR